MFATVLNVGAAENAEGSVPYPSLTGVGSWAAVSLGSEVEARSPDPRIPPLQERNPLAPRRLL